MSITSKPTTPEYADGWDRIFGKKKIQHVELPVVKVEVGPDEVAVAMKVEREKLTAEWHKFCETNQRKLARIPHFEEWKRGEYEWTDEGNAPD